MTDGLAGRAKAWLQDQAQKPNRAIAALLAAALGLRALLAPVLGDSHVYALSFPLILFTAYLYGPRRALVTMGLAGLAGFLLFAHPFESWAMARRAATALMLFAANSGAVIYLVAALTRTTRELTLAQGRSEAQANTHAELFREVNERITHHLRLVAGVLALQANGEPEAAVSQGLRKAAQRSLQISRAHAELAGRGGEAVAFREVCERIVQALLTAQGEPADRVRIEAGDDLALDAESATALAAALLECLAAVLKLEPQGRITVRLSCRGQRCSAEIRLADETAAERLAALGEGYLLQAVIEQLGASLKLRRAEGRAVLEVAFETEPEAYPRPLAAQTLH